MRNVYFGAATEMGKNHSRHGGKRIEMGKDSKFSAATEMACVDVVCVYMKDNFMCICIYWL